MKKYSSVLLFGLVLIVIVGWFSVFTVDQTQTALVLELGKPVSDALKPGLHFKLPYQNVIYFDARVLEYDAPPAEVLTKDKKNLVVDNYSRWKIIDPLLFYKSVQTIRKGISRIDDIVYAQLRVALGNYLLTEIVSTKRNEIMQKVTQNCDRLLRNYGIAVLDVRIKRTDLPPENERAIYNRMKAERERQAKMYRSEGKEEAAKIRAKTDRERAVMLAQAQKQAEELKGQGDALATAIYAKALSQGPDFYAFYKSLQAYKSAFNKRTQFILTPQTEFLRFLKEK